MRRPTAGKKRKDATDTDSPGASRALHLARHACGVAGEHLGARSVRRADGYGRERLCASLQVGGVTSHPTGKWTVQQDRNFAITPDERFEDIKSLIRDRGSNFAASFDAVFQAVGAKILHTAVQAPHINTTCERLVGYATPSSWTTY